MFLTNVFCKGNVKGIPSPSPFRRSQEANSRTQMDYQPFIATNGIDITNKSAAKHAQHNSITDQSIEAYIVTKCYALLNIRKGI